MIVDIRRFAAACLCSLAVLGLTGCQAGHEGPVRPARDKTTLVEPPSTLTTQSTGRARVALFVDASVASVAADYRDGAMLAEKALGAGRISLSVHDLRGPDETNVEQAVEKVAGEAALLIGPPSLSEAFAKRTGSSAAIVLGAHTADRSVALLSDEVDGLLDVAAYAAGKARPKILAVASRPLTADEKARLETGVKARGGEWLGLISGVDDGRAGALLKQAQAVLLVGDGAAPLAAALRQRGLGLDVPFLGTGTWPATSYATPALEGSLLALVDQAALQRISKPYQVAYGRPLTLEAAYGFDAVAVAAGIVRAEGAAALTQPALATETGFAGATGLFRFGTDGRIERRFAIYRLSGGKPERLEAAPAAF